MALERDYLVNGAQRILKTIDQKKPIVNFLRNRYFPGVLESEDEDVLMETRRGGEIILPSVYRGDSPGMAGKLGSHQIDKVTPAYWSNFASLTVKELNKRIFGEDPVSPFSYEQRALQNIADKVMNIRRSYALAEEAIASEVLKTGQYIPRYWDGVKLIPGTAISFGVNSKLVGGAIDSLWTTATTDIPGKISDLCKLLFDADGTVPTEMIVGKDVLAMLRANTSFMSALDNRRIEGNQLKTIADAAYPGVAVNGTINVPMYGDIVIMSYVNEYKLFDNKTTGKMIGDKDILLTTSGWGSMGYGATYGQVNGYPALVPGKEHFDVETGTPSNNYALKAFLQTAPLAIPTKLDAWVYKKVVA